MPKTASRLSFIEAGIAQQHETIAKRTPSVHPVRTDRTQQTERTVRKAETKPTERREHVTLNLPRPLLARLRAAAYWVPGASMSNIIERAADAELTRLEKAHNKGRAFERP